MPLEVTEVRARVVRRFHSILDNDVLAKQLDVCLWNWTLKSCLQDKIPIYWENKRFRYRYTTRALSLAYNLKSNPDLLGKIWRREVGLKQYAHMTPQEMRPDIYEPIYERLAKKHLKRMVPLDAESAPDGIHTCGRCKSKKTVYTQLQTRSADEPMTVFIACLSCGKHWKN